MEPIPPKHTTSVHTANLGNPIAFFEMIEGYYDRPVSWLDAAEPLSLSLTAHAAEHRIEIKGVPVEAGYQAIPNHAFDVVSLFNLTDHVHNPVETLQHAVRIVKADGVLWLTTQDPVLGSSKDPKLRPISYWVSLLLNLRLDVCLRFGEGAYQVELLAGQKNSTAFHTLQSTFSSAGLSMKLPVISKNGLMVVPRPAVETKHRASRCFYVLNTGKTTLQARLSIESKEPQNPDVFLDDLKLRYCGSTSEQNHHHHRWKPVPIAPGGHSLMMHTGERPFTILKKNWETEAISQDRFIRSLAFDHYQRYRMVADILRGLPNPPKTLLDVGGAYGYLHQFYPEAEVVVLDRALEDFPNAMRYETHDLPFADNRFDAVVCIDTLEHIPPGQRTAFLNELYRVSIYSVITACPFEGDQTREADSIIREFAEVQLGKTDRFLDEHQEYTLPDLEKTRAVFEAKGFSVHVFPNGFLPRWVLMQMATFAMGVSPELHEAKARLNAIYNQGFYPADNVEPSYRKVIVATRNPINENVLSALRKKIMPQDKIIPQAASLSTPTQWDTGLAPAWVAFSAFGAMREKDSALTSSAQRISKLLEHLHNVDAREQSEAQYRQKLLEHLHNVDAREQSEAQYRQKLLEHLHNLESEMQKQRDHIQKQQEHAENLCVLLNEKQKTIQDLQAHIQHLDRSIQDHQESIHHQQTHTAHLDRAIQDMQTHNRNLEQLLKEKETHLQNVQAHAENLSSLLKEKDEHQANLTRHAENLLAQVHAAEQENQRLISHLRINEWYFDTALPRLHQTDCSQADILQILERKEQDLGDMPEELARFWQGLKALCLQQAKEQQQLHAIRSSVGFKLLSLSGLIPAKRNPDSP